MFLNPCKEQSGSFSIIVLFCCFLIWLCHLFFLFLWASDLTQLVERTWGLGFCFFSLFFFSFTPPLLNRVPLSPTLCVIFFFMCYVTCICVVLLFKHHNTSILDSTFSFVFVVDCFALLDSIEDEIQRRKFYRAIRLEERKWKRRELSFGLSSVFFFYRPYIGMEFDRCFG